MDSSPHSMKKFQTMDELQAPDGMDPSCTFKMKLRIHPVSKERRKQFPGGYTAIEFIESDTANYKDFIEWLNDKYPSKHDEAVLLTYVDPVSKAHCDVSSVKSVCASNEIEDTQTLAIIPVANLSPIRKQPARKKASIPTEQEKQASDVGKKKKKAPSKKKGPPKKKGPEPSKKRKKAAAQPSTPSKKKKAATEEPSTPVNKKKNVALPDSPAMSTRSKLKL
ncbi:hypothetical protein EJB05_45136 [Eragrostis curvula]|uniref:Uncharacterized protein n=1 Tax=Eragrostis curvula TaxID=38414 RepID=A0A5J9TJF5_9POAL|nr:hypothetical protein EJB05_45136 [Eragrostis curvula]